ncbi:MAG: hypothetical protein AAF570_19135, partial [Bacteroidota bacterium]
MFAELLLPPKSASGIITWQYGKAPLTDQARDVLVLSVCPDDYFPFSSLLQTYETLRTKFTSEHAATLAPLMSRVKEIHDQATMIGKKGSLADGIAANRGVRIALRRISREGIELSSLIHLVARAFQNAMGGLEKMHMVLPMVDRLDRLSLKVYGRMCLIADVAMEWTWQFNINVDDIGHTASVELGDCFSAKEILGALWRKSRQNLFSILADVLNPIVREVGNYTQSAIPSNGNWSEISLSTASTWLSLLSYDTCLLWAMNQSALVDSSHTDYIDVRRVLGIVAMNLGAYDLAVRYLLQACDAASARTLRAHLFYMVGLIYAKRLLDLELSEVYYQKGLAELDSELTDEDEGDVDVERAWIFNGIALNNLIRERLGQNEIDKVFAGTFEMLTKAFGLVKKGHNPDRIYLRYNLLTNMSSFLSIQGEYNLALRLLEQTFETISQPDEESKGVWNSAPPSLRAPLYAKIGQLDIAITLLEDARIRVVQQGCPIRQEMLGR